MCYMYYLKYLKIHNSIMRTIPHLDTGFDDYEILHLGSDGMKIVGCYSREGYS